MKYLNRLVLLLASLLFIVDLVYAAPAGDLVTQGRAAFIARDGYNLNLGTQGDDDLIVRQNNVTTFSIDGATGAVSFSGGLTLVDTLTFSSAGTIVSPTSLGVKIGSVTEATFSDDSLVFSGLGAAVKGAGTTGLLLAGAASSEGIGSYTTWSGNTHGNVGSVVNQLGNVSGAVYTISGTHASSFISTNLPRLQFTSNTSQVIGNGTTGLLLSGASSSDSIGSYTTWGGNTHANTGSVINQLGNVSGAIYYILGTHSSSGINTNLSFTSSKTTSLGWVVVDQTDNQACNTGCTSACVMGFDNATGTAVTNVVSCDATTADLCLCAGAS